MQTLPKYSVFSHSKQHCDKTLYQRSLSVVQISFLGLLCPWKRPKTLKLIASAASFSAAAEICFHLLSHPPASSSLPLDPFFQNSFLHPHPCSSPPSLSPSSSLSALRCLHGVKLYYTSGHWRSITACKFKRCFVCIYSFWEDVTNCRLFHGLIIL